MAGYDGTPRYGGDRGTAPGTAATLRVDPHEALYLNMRYVDDVVIDVSDYNTMKVVKSLGGLDSFEYNASAVEWVEHDLYRRSDVTNGAIANNATSVTVTGKAHRYPIGTVLMFIDPDGTMETGTATAGTTEFVRVTAQTDANTLAIGRDYTDLLGTSSGSWPAWASGARFYVAGASVAEGSTWVTRDTFVKALKYNVGQIMQESVSATWRDQGTARYGQAGNDFDEQVALCLKTKALALEQNVLLGRRLVGLSTAEPAMMGGVLFYVDSTDGDASVQETDKAGGALVLKDINDTLQEIAQIVGEENCAKTIFTDYWGHRKINSFFEPSVRLAREENTVGLIVQTIDTVVGPVQVIADANMPRGKMLFLNPDQGKVGHHTNGRLRMGDVGYQPGDYDQTWIYGDYSLMFKNPVTCGKIEHYSLTA